MAEVNVLHASAGIVASEDTRVAGNSFNSEIQLPPTREMYRWMADITDCINQTVVQNKKLIQDFSDIIQRVDNIEQSFSDLSQEIVDIKQRLDAGSL